MPDEMKPQDAEVGVPIPAVEERERLRRMFDEAARELTNEERADRELLLRGFSPEE